jgi:hypothetical protein
MVRNASGERRYRRSDQGALHHRRRLGSLERPGPNRPRTRQESNIAEFDFTHLALAASAAHERVASPAPAAAAIVVTGLVTLGLLGARVTLAEVGDAAEARTATLVAAPPAERPADRFVELDNGRGVEVFREIYGVLTTRLRLYRASA